MVINKTNNGIKVTIYIPDNTANKQLKINQIYEILNPKKPA